MFNKKKKIKDKQNHEALNTDDPHVCIDCGLRYTIRIGASKTKELYLCKDCGKKYLFPN